MKSFLMTAENGQKVYDRVKTQTRRLPVAKAAAIIEDLAGTGPDASPLAFQYVIDQERLHDDEKPYRYTGEMPR